MRILPPNNAGVNAGWRFHFCAGAFALPGRRPGVAQLFSLGVFTMTMKYRIFILAAICIVSASAIAATIAFTSVPTWSDKGSPPRLSMPDAYSCAVAALGSTTNQFFCITATCAKSEHQNDGVWYFIFSNTNGVKKTTYVYPDKKTRVTNSAGPQVQM
jgi:hypothetical protein